MPSFIRAAKDGGTDGIAHPTPPGAVNEAKEHPGSATSRDVDLRARYIRSKLVLHIWNFLDEVKLTDEEWSVWIRIVNDLGKIPTSAPDEPTHVQHSVSPATPHEEDSEPRRELHKLSGPRGDSRTTTYRPSVSQFLYDLGYPFTTPTPPMPPPSLASSRSSTPDPPSSMSAGTLLVYSSKPSTFGAMRNDKSEVYKDGAFAFQVAPGTFKETLWSDSKKAEISTGRPVLHRAAEDANEAEELDGDMINGLEYVRVSFQSAPDSEQHQYSIGRGKEVLAAGVCIDEHRPQQAR